MKPTNNPDHPQSFKMIPSFVGIFFQHLISLGIGHAGQQNEKHITYRYYLVRDSIGTRFSFHVGRELDSGECKNWKGVIICSRYPALTNITLLSLQFQNIIQLYQVISFRCNRLTTEMEVCVLYPILKSCSYSCVEEHCLVFYDKKGFGDSFFVIYKQYLRNTTLLFFFKVNIILSFNLGREISIILHWKQFT